MKPNSETQQEERSFYPGEHECCRPQNTALPSLLSSSPMSLPTHLYAHVCFTSLFNCVHCLCTWTQGWVQLRALTVCFGLFPRPWAPSREHLSCPGIHHRSLEVSGTWKVVNTYPGTLVTANQSQLVFGSPSFGE